MAGQQVRPEPGRDRAEWSPDWTVAPADMLLEWMDDAAMDVEQTARLCGIPAHRIRRVLDKKPLGHRTAEALARGTRINAGVWLRLEAMYRRDLAAGKEETL